MKVKETAAQYRVPSKTFTYQDYLDLPEDGNRYEVIEGELIMAPAPHTIHQRINRNIVYELLKFIEEKKTGDIFYAPTDVVLSQTNVLQPDILFIAKENSHIITEKNISGAPDLIIEIVSLTTAYYDLIAKKEIYENFGVKEYWIVDPKKQWVELYQNVRNKFELQQRLEKKGMVKSQVLEGFQVNLEKIFDLE